MKVTADFKKARIFSRVVNVSYGITVQKGNVSVDSLKLNYWHPLKLKQCTCNYPIKWKMEWWKATEVINAGIGNGCMSGWVLKEYWCLFLQ